MTATLENKISFITGGALGIGRATALAFAREGATVVIADILEEQGRQTAADIAALGATARFIPCDVTRAGQVSAAIQQVVAEFGRLDCAFNNAGFEGRLAPTAEYDEEEWDRVVAINLKGVWLCLKYELQQMIGQRRGAIVSTASVAGVVAERGYPAYAAAKGGVIQLTRTAAAEYAACSVRINAISPGIIITPMIDRALCDMDIKAMMPGAVKNNFLKNLTNRLLHWKPVQQQFTNMMQPIGRPGQPEEIAAAVVFLCSDAAAFITGHNLLVDGGMTITKI